jgi:hypothetical protein
LTDQQINAEYIELKDQIEKFVNALTKKYPKNRSISRHPRKPHFNKDSLTDCVCSYAKEKGMRKFDCDYFLEKIDGLNDDYGKGIRINLNDYSKTALKKAQLTNSYIFLKDFLYDIPIPNAVK